MSGKILSSLEMFPVEQELKIVFQLLHFLFFPGLQFREKTAKRMFQAELFSEVILPLKWEN